MPKVTPFLWFDSQAHEAAKLYVSIFKRGSKITNVVRTGKKRAVMAVTFKVAGQELQALNGGPHYKLSPAISLYVDCKTQGEVDELWKKLVRGGEPLRCGWLTDRYGLSWQIIPSVLIKRMHDPNPAKASAVVAAMMKMVKIDIAEIERAYRSA